MSLSHAEAAETATHAVTAWRDQQTVSGPGRYRLPITTCTSPARMLAMCYLWCSFSIICGKVIFAAAVACNRLRCTCTQGFEICVTCRCIGQEEEEKDGQEQRQELHRGLDRV